MLGVQQWKCSVACAQAHTRKNMFLYSLERAQAIGLASMSRCIKSLLTCADLQSIVSYLNKKKPNYR